MDNMTIWEFGAHTAPSAVKKTTSDGYPHSSINATYMAKKATELFGPIGTGWGYDIIEERYDDAGPIFDVNNGELLCHAKNHTILLRLWYKVGNEIGTVSQFGHTKYIYKSKYGFTVDSEAPKKTLTDAMKKCLSLLGFSADIFLGQFDDQDYVEAQAAKEELEKADNRAEVQTKQEMEYKDWFNNTIRLMEESKTLPMLEGLFKTAVRKANARNDKKAILRFTETKDKMIAKIEEIQHG